LANRLFLGAHFDDVGKMRFSESRFAFQELPAWIARRAFEVEFKEGGIATARHEFPPHIVVLSETMRARAARERALTPPSSQD